MGNSNVLCSRYFSDENVSDNLGDRLNPRQKHLAQETLEMMRHCLADLGTIVFLRFFEMEPSMKELFPKFIHINEDNKLDINTDFRRVLGDHASFVMHSLGAAVENIDQSELFDVIVEDIGKLHADRSVQIHMIQRLWPSLDYGLREILGQSYDKEVSEAWREVFFYLCQQMRKGMKRQKTDSISSSDSE